MANFVENKMESWIKLDDKIIKLKNTKEFRGSAQKSWIKSTTQKDNKITNELLMIKMYFKPL